MLRDSFGFAEHQQKATYGLRYKLTLARKNDSAVFNRSDAVNNVKSSISSNERLVSHYTPTLERESILLKQVKNEVPTDLHYVERPVFMQEVKNQKL